MLSLQKPKSPQIDALRIGNRTQVESYSKYYYYYYARPRRKLEEALCAPPFTERLARLNTFDLKLFWLYNAEKKVIQIGPTKLK